MEYYVRYIEGMEKCSFKAGDVVLITGYYEHCTEATGAVGTISGVHDIWAQCIYYDVVIEGNDVKDAIVVDEDYLRLATPKDVIEFDDDAFYDKPSFQLGDVVLETNDVYVVSDILNMVGKEDSKYVYELTPIGLDPDVIIREGHSLEYQYHDNAWREYFTDIVHNCLPEWKGELYQYVCLGEWYDDLSYREERRRHNTLPSDSMEHIWNEYSIDGRLGAVFASAKNEREITKTFNSKDLRELDKLIQSFSRKIYNRNMREYAPDFESEINDRSKFNFTNQEILFASEVDRLDSTFGFHREHFPLEMTWRQVMQAVKEAYCNAKRIGRRKIRTYEKWCVKGNALYEGVTKNGLTIQFWYNFDQDKIETAYPIRMGDSAKKHE